MERPASTVAAPDYSRSDFAHSPLVVFYEVTQACDLVCQHCRACAQPLPAPNELLPEQSLRLMEQFAAFPKPPLVVLTGGDPLKRADLFDLIRYASRLGLNVAVTPAATPLVTGEALDKLQEAGVVRLAISLDGATAESHDTLRGVPGSFQRTFEILQASQDRGIPAQVNTTLTQLNVGEIDAIADLITPFDIVLWSVFFLVPVGRGTVLERLSAEDCEQAFAQLWEISQRGDFALKTTEAPHYRRFLLQQRKQQKKSPGSEPSGNGAALTAETRAGVGPGETESNPSTRRSLPRQGTPLGVNDGKGVMFVGHNGEICPTGFLPITCGQFPQDDVVDIYQNSPTFVSLRDPDLLEGKCGECEYRTLCGGSRARSYALTGNLFASELDCIYQPPNR